MNEQREDRTGENDTPALTDVDEGLHVGFIGAEEFEERARLEMHRHERIRDRSHVDLTQEEYTPEEVARLIGTSLEVVMHAIWAGELKAQRKGQDVICIKHEDVTDWLRRRIGV
jgi:excisionase family DNA binding protein